MFSPGMPGHWCSPLYKPLWLLSIDLHTSCIVRFWIDSSASDWARVMSGRAGHMDYASWSTLGQTKSRTTNSRTGQLWTNCIARRPRVDQVRELLVRDLVCPRVDRLPLQDYASSLYRRCFFGTAHIHIIHSMRAEDIKDISVIRHL